MPKASRWHGALSWSTRGCPGFWKDRTLCCSERFAAVCTAGWVGTAKMLFWEFLCQTRGSTRVQEQAQRPAPPEVSLATFDETLSLWEPWVPICCRGRQSSPGPRVAMELPGGNAPGSPAQEETYQRKAHRPLEGWILISAQGERIAFRKERGFIKLLAGGGGG